MREMNRKEAREDNRVLENILAALFSVLPDREEMPESDEEGKHGSDTDRDRRPEKVAVCRDPSELILMFTPGEQSVLLTQKDGYPMIAKAGRDQVMYEICKGDYLISYDGRQALSREGFRDVKGPVFVIALDGEGNTRDMTRADICFLVHQLESRVCISLDDGQRILRLEENEDDETE